MSEEQPRYLTITEAAQRINVTSADVARLCHEQKLPGARKVGSRWVIPASAVNTWLARSLTMPPATPDASVVWQRFRNQPWVFWPTLVISILAGIFLFVFGLIQAGADFPSAYKLAQEIGLAPTNTPTPTDTPIPSPTPPIATAMDDEILILIATFHTANGRQSAVEDELRAAIRDQIANLNLANIRVEIDPTIIEADDRRKAEELGRRYRATTIIWGSDTDFRVQTNYLNIASADTTSLTNKTFHEQERTYLTAPNEYVQFVVGELSPQVTFLSLFAIGRASNAAGNYATTIQVLEYAMNRFAANLDPQLQSELHGVWFELALAHQFLDNNEVALGYYTQALNGNHLESYGAYNNRGNIYKNQGNLEQAIANYNMAIELNPANATAY